MHALQRGGMMPDREAAVSQLRKMERLQARIEEIDTRLFDALLPVLTEAQLPLVDRERLARERRRYQAQGMVLQMGRAPVDLGDVFRETDLPADVRAEVDPEIADYERRLTSAMREVSKAAARMNVDMLDAFQARGYGDMDQEQLADPEVMAKMMKDMQEIWAEIGAGLAEKSARIIELNRRTYRRVAALLPEEAGRDFRAAYYRREYPELSFIFFMRSEKGFDRMIDRQNLTGEQRELAAAAVDGYRQQLDRMIDDAVKRIDARREGSSPFDFDRESMQERQRELMEIQKAVRELTTTTMAAINQVIGERAPAEVAAEAQRNALALVGAEALLEDPEAPADPAAKEARNAEEPFVNRIDQWVPGPPCRPRTGPSTSACAWP